MVDFVYTTPILQALLSPPDAGLAVLQHCYLGTMAARILVLYKPPPDPAAFDKYYFGTPHVPIARKIPHLRSMKFNAGPPVAMAGTAPHLIAELEFDTMSQSAGGHGIRRGAGRAAADVRNFAQDPTLLIYETRLDGLKKKRKGCGRDAIAQAIGALVPAAECYVF